jgi:L-lactate dehydrogenase complex protein LldG
MSSRDVVMGRIRAALGSVEVPIEVPRTYRRTADGGLDLLIERLEDYKAVVHRGASVADTVAELVTGRLVVPPGIDPEWLPSTVEVLRDDGLDADVLAVVDGVLTAATVAVAETGTIVLDGSPDQGRRIISLLPDLHICVIRPEQVVASVPEAVARLDPRRPLTWISGPSATSDIELNRVEGVHGPRQLHVIVLEEAV